MNSVSVGCKADVNAIINDERGSGLCSITPCHATQLPRTAKKASRGIFLSRLGGSRCQRLVTQLDQRRARRNQLFCIRHDGHDWIRLHCEAGEVDDGVKGGESNLAPTGNILLVHERITPARLIRFQLGSCVLFRVYRAA
jgi:hypothetical protein